MIQSQIDCRAFVSDRARLRAQGQRGDPSGPMDAIGGVGGMNPASTGNSSPRSYGKKGCLVEIETNSRPPADLATPEGLRKPTAMVSREKCSARPKPWCILTGPFPLRKQRLEVGASNVRPW